MILLFIIFLVRVHFGAHFTETKGTAKAAETEEVQEAEKKSKTAKTVCLLHILRVEQRERNEKKENIQWAKLSGKKGAFSMVIFWCAMINIY